MDLRKFLGALALGLPTAILAHILSFGSDHTLGGAAHQVVIDGSLAAVCASVSALFVGVVYLAAGRRDGSIVASHLTGFLPSWRLVFVAAGSWFALIESAESTHGASLILVVLALLAVAIGARALAAFGLRALSALVVALLSLEFAKQTFFLELAVAPVPRAASIRVAPTRLSRPPPVFF